MWLLEADGDLLQNKKHWLRPGKRFLFGRTKAELDQIAIEHKTVSRKHLTITVAPLKPGDGGQIYNRSGVTIEDHGSKFGSLLNGVSIKSKSTTLDDKKDVFTIKLGNSEKQLRLVWKPVTWTCSLPSKKTKLEDPLSSLRSQVEPLDIKCVVPYTVNAITHVVATKRNTVKGLQALINGKFIVNEQYIDAVVEAARPDDPDDVGSLAPLEQDFDRFWPDPLKFLPPRRNEPSERPDDEFAPSVDRSQVFEGYTFIFCDHAQHKDLSQPINNGGGKSLLFQLKNGSTTAEELVRFSKDAAGEDGSGPFEDGCGGPGVVLVRFKSKAEWFQWSVDLGNEVSQILDHRLIEQNEFLEAVLTNDASRLRRQLRDDGENPQRSKRATNGPNEESAIQTASTVQHNSKPTRRLRGLIESKFKGFDDSDDDIMAIPPYQSSKQNQNRPTVQDSATIPNSQSSETEDLQPRTGQKRSAAQIQDEEDDAVFMDGLFPGATAMKKRRVEKAISLSPSPEPPLTSKATKEKPEKQLDIIAAARSHREEEDAAAKARQAAERSATIDGEDISQLRNLAIIETMPVSRPPAKESNGNDGVTDNERWAGRKNFKKFRRRGTENGSRSFGSRVIVSLQEAKRNEYSINEEFLLSSHSGPSGRGQQSRQNQDDDSSDEESDGPLFVQSQEYETAEERLEIDDEDEGSIRSSFTARNSKGKGKAAASGQKRSEPKTLMKPPPPKRQKRFAIQQAEDSDDDSGDELRFKF